MELATKTTSAAISASVLAAGSATGSLVVFYDNPRTGGSTGTLHVVCGAMLNRGHPPAIPRTSADGNTVVYGYQGTAYRAGIYAYTLP
jgi:hypothetical protein